MELSVRRKKGGAKRRFLIVVKGYTSWWVSQKKMEIVIFCDNKVEKKHVTTF